jgi:uroporphyrinogen-III decarboxylase
VDNLTVEVNLTPEQKRQERAEKFLNPTGVNFKSPEAAKNYRIRAQRLLDVYAVKQPDRVPANLHFSSLPLKLAGIDYRVGISDYAQTAQAYRSFNERYSERLDTYANPATIPPWSVLDILGFTMYSWPGHGLPPRASGFQFVESEYMKVSEYPDLIKNPSDFWMRTYLPRVFQAFQCFSSLDSLTEIMEVPSSSLMPLATSPVQDMLRKLLAAGAELEKRNATFKDFGRLAQESGFYIPITYFGKAPFDVLGDTLRGTQGIMKDMYRNPELLLEAMDGIADLWIKYTVAKARKTKGLSVNFPLHKGADGWMSQKQFDKFYWPPLKKMINAFIAEGLVIHLFAEGAYNSRLDSVNEFPKGSIHWWFDKTDIFRAKKVLGSQCSFAGNVPASLLCTGTPQEVTAYCRKLIEECGPGGGYMLAEGAADSGATLENLIAMADCARTFGVYK